MAENGNAANSAANGGANAASAPIDPPTNFLSWVWNSTAKTAEELLEEASAAAADYARITFKVLAYGIAIPILLLIVAVCSGYYGEAGGYPRFVAFAQYAALASGLIVTLGMLVFWLLNSVATTAVVAGSTVGNAIWRRIPVLTPYAAQQHLIWLRTATVWITFAGLYVAMVPVWRDPAKTIVIAIGALALAGIMSARWATGPWPRRIVTFLSLLAVLYGTVALAFPRVLDWGGSALRGTETVIGHQIVKTKDVYHDYRARDALEEEAETAAQSRDNALLKRLIEEQHALRQSVVVNGDFPSEEARKRSMQLAIEIGYLQRGSDAYWKWKTEAQEKEASGQPTRQQAASSQKTDGGRATQAPKKGRAHGQPHRHFTDAELDEIFAPIQRSR